MRKFSESMQRLLFGAMALLFSLSLFQSQWGMTMTDVTNPVPGMSQSAPSKAERLIEKHGCWTDEAPANMAGKVPGHVVFTKANAGARVGGPVMVGKALDQIFAGEEHGLTVHGFCR